MAVKNIMKESEKVLEAKLVEHVKKKGGLAIKLSSMFIKGLPDRLVLLPGGRILFIEVKTTGMQLRPAQGHIAVKLINLGFTFILLDSSEQIKQI
jgi:Holliday junction resolvase